MKTKQLALIGLMSAILCILGPLSLPIPISPVPISLGTLAVYFVVYVLGMKQGTISLCIYLLLGAVGLPVFSSFGGGIGKILGPTGGYLLGYLFMAVICGYFLEKWERNYPMCFLGMALGTAACYLFGSLWLGYQADISFSAALAAGVLPFIPGDFFKIIIAMFLGEQVRRQLRKAGLLAGNAERTAAT